MRIIVQKFGGTSLSTPEAKERVIQHIQRERDNGYAVVVVVSAMGRSPEPYATDTLLSQLEPYSDSISLKERDMLLSCGELISATLIGAQIRAAHIPAVVFSGGEAGIQTDEEFGSAKIIAIKPDRILKALQKGQVVIVAGFQGMTKQGAITTLGRGGSDTSATALGAALHAEIVDIYTDVNGILTADPKLVRDAKPIAKVSYAEICHMAREGAKVVHPRAVEIAQQARIPVRIRSTFSDDEGTLVQDTPWEHNEHTVLDRHVTGIAHAKGITQLNVFGSNTTEHDPQLIFETLANHQISVDFINVSAKHSLFTVRAEQDKLAYSLLVELGFEVTVNDACAKLSIIGGGMNGQPGVMAKIVAALTEQRIPILQSADSNAAIWVLVKEEYMSKALTSLHSTFDLNR